MTLIVIGWVRSGADNQAPLAVLISNAQDNYKTMFVGPEWADHTFIDLHWQPFRPSNY